MARWNKLPPQLIAILILLGIWLAVKLYENITILILSIIVIIIFLLIWIYIYGFSLQRYSFMWIKNYSSVYTKIIAGAFIFILSLSFINIASNQEYYKQQFQKSISNGFSSVVKWFFAFRNPSRFIIKEVKRDMRENISESGSVNE